MLKIYVEPSLAADGPGSLEKYRRKAVFSTKEDDCYSESWDIMIFHGVFPFEYAGLPGLYSKFPFCSLFIIPGNLVSPDIVDDKVLVYSDPSYMMKSFSKILDLMLLLKNRERVLESYRSRKDPFFSGGIISGFLHDSRSRRYSSRHLLVTSECGVERFYPVDHIFPDALKVKAGFGEKNFEELVFFLKNEIIESGVLKKDGPVFFIDGLMCMERNEQMCFLDLMNRINTGGVHRLVLGLEKTCADRIGFIKDFFDIIEIPALRNRKPDIQSLVVELYFTRAKEHGIAAKMPSAALLQFSENFYWPGNHAQLSDFVDSMLFMGEVEALKRLSRDFNEGCFNMDRINLNEIVRDYKNTLENLLVSKAISESGNNRKMAASMLGISYKSLCHKLNGHAFESVPEL